MTTERLSTPKERGKAKKADALVAAAQSATTIAKLQAVVVDLAKLVTGR